MTLLSLLLGNSDVLVGLVGLAAGLLGYWLRSRQDAAVPSELDEILRLLQRKRRQDQTREVLHELAALDGDAASEPEPDPDAE